MSLRFNLAYPLLMLILGGILSGCEVTPEKISQWKGIESGPRKLRDAVRDENLKLETRGAAAEALVELALQEDLALEVKELKPASQVSLLAVLVPLLVKMAMGDESAAPSSRKQRNAKDALFLLRDAAQGAQRSIIDAALVEWCLTDLTGRQTAGGHATAKILRAIGPKSGVALVTLLKKPGPDFDLAARLLGQVGDEQTRNQAGEILIELARKEKPIKDATFEALGRVGGAAVVRFFGDLVDHSREREEDAKRALLALKLSPRPEALPLALRAALDRKQKDTLRHDALELCTRIGAKAAGDGVLPVMADPDVILGWHAFEVVMATLKAEGLAPAFDKLTLKHLAKKDDLADFLVRHVKEQVGAAARAPLVAQLRSKNPGARLAAVLCLKELGTTEDAGEIEKLATDTTKIRGWPGTPTIGSEARAAVERLRQKR
jgi:sirohydrochlorin ferrochelatase